MLKLAALTAKFPELELRNLSDSVDVTNISFDNRKIHPAGIFAALAGFQQHGILFAESALAAGAVAILTDKIGAEHSPNLPLIIHPNPREIMGLIARELTEDAQAQLIKFGITGTNGKTTTSYMIYAMLEELQQSPSLIGTIGIRIAGEEAASSRTTPESTDLHNLMRTATMAGSKSLAMEVSSHAMDLHRIAGMKFKVAIFTGLTQDHLDFHKTMENYYLAKAKLFSSDFAEYGIVCIDDEWGKRLARESQIPVTTYAVHEAADWSARDVRRNEDGSVDFIAQFHADSFAIHLKMPGDFNIANSLAALAAVNAAGFSPALAARALAQVAVPGRVERINQNQPFVVLVDYAHTPDAVTRALEVAHLCTSKNVISVLGCGGDRDRAKRPLMGAAASQNSLLIVTDDNPRSENPATIRSEMLAGVPTGSRTLEVADRTAAIRKALEMAEPGDCVIILGKGHERGQEIAGTIFPFDDRAVAAELLREIYG